MQTTVFIVNNLHQLHSAAVELRCPTQPLGQHKAIKVLHCAIFIAIIIATVVKGMCSLRPSRPLADRCDCS